ncbi:peptidase associated/transthyretin-like domain-containing protein [Neolewinella persica]|uniref:hypothetical protein n=1 Tax=Neolewinella persica TaxID=70998 RepID=UPI000361B579|nr:hypothetical protein [Neolewinella persica]
MKRLFLLVFLLLTGYWCNAQLSVYGTVSGEETKKGEAFVQVVLYSYPSNKVIAHTYTSEAGKYQLQLPMGKQVYVLRTNSLAHRNVEREIVVANDNTKRIKVDLSLAIQQFTIDSVRVVAKMPPIVVKEDTTIYHVASFSDETDQTLEEVLSKIPGFEILSNGGIKVKGKAVGKVLVNGEEITDGGAGLLTRGLSHERVKSVEVRFKEKDARIRESLLSNADLVVLDIKLKDDFSTSLFGRLSPTIGYEENAELSPGGVANIFSLNEKVKLHLVTEYDRFGDQTISLSRIKNIGKEAYAAIFDVPADFSRVRENPEYQSELYGFKEADAFELGSVGLSAKVSLSPDLDLYLGSYNYLDDVSSSRDASQTEIVGGDTFVFNEQSGNRIAGSKNKAELKLDRPGLKATYNFNAVFTESTNILNALSGTIGTQSFRSADQENSIYHNFLLERKTGEQSGFQLDAFYNRFTVQQDRTLQSEGVRDGTIFGIPETNDFVVEQRIPVIGSRTIANGFYQFLMAGQQVKTGLRLLQDQLEGEKQFLYEGEFLEDSPFISNLTTLRYQQAFPFIQLTSNFGQFSLSNKFGYSFNRYPTLIEGTSASTGLFEINTQANVDLGDEQSLNLNYSRQTSRFSMAQLLLGQDLIGFQTIGQPGVNELRPRIEQVLQFSANSWALDDLGIGVELSGIAGQARNGSGFNTASFPLLTETYDQLTSRYAVGLLKVAKVFNDFPIQLRLEQSYIANQDENRSPGEEDIFRVETRVGLTNLKATTTFKNMPHNFRLDFKRVGARYFSEISPAINRQVIWNTAFRQIHYFNKRKIVASVNWRYASFAGQQQSELFLVDADLSFKLKKCRVNLLVNNLFDAGSIATQGTSSGFFFNDNRNIFGRYLKAGLTFDLN